MNKCYKQLFLVRNMDIHFSETYFGQDKDGNKVDFNELITRISRWLDAIDSIRKSVWVRVQGYCDL